MDDTCEHLEEFLKCEMALINRHIQDHKYFQRIPDLQDGIRDFIEKYGWIMREFYCGYVCKGRGSCQYGKGVGPDVELDNFSDVDPSAKTRVMKAIKKED